MRTQHITVKTDNYPSLHKITLAATIAVALAFVSCTELKEVEFFTPDERAAIMARGSSSSSSEESSSSALKECESVPGSGAFCYDGLIHDKCGGVEYIPATHICQGGSARPAKCNNESYNPLEHKCEDGILKNRCGAGDEYYYISDKYNWYNPSTHFCHTDGNTYSCGDLPLNPSTQFCFSDGIYSKCGGDDYDPTTHFCYEGSKIGNFCGINPQKYYDPNLYQCKPGVNPNGIFLKSPVSYEGESYEAVLLGEQTWLAKNLNYNASGSKCYDNKFVNCDKYGRLYNWATAMGGICPPNWHLPSNAEWTTLALFADGTGTYGENGPAGTKLKAKSGWDWEAHVTYGNGTDDYGFSALPGGLGFSYGDFYSAGGYGYWWSSSEYSSDNAYYRFMSYDNEGANYYYYNKRDLYSVRCVKD